MDNPDAWGRGHTMYCVIAGDIINSTEIAQPATRERILAAAKTVFARINFEYHPALLIDFGMVRGDAFEGVLLAQHLAPRIIQEIIKGFYRIEKTCVRISAVIGDLSVIGSDRNETDGPAFHQAFKDLEALKEGKSNHWLQVSLYVGSSAQPVIDGMLRLLTALTEGWTDKQREIAWELEARGMQQKLVCKALGITKGVVHKQLKAANYEAYRLAWDNLEHYLLADGQGYWASYNAGLSRYDQGQYDQAASLLNQSLAQASKEVGEDNPSLAPIYHLLACIHMKAGRLRDAKDAIHASIRLQHKLPLARAQYIHTLSTMAEICLRENGPLDIEKAAEVLNTAVALAACIMTGTDPLMLKLQTDLASMHFRRGQYDDALSLYLGILETANESDCPITYGAATLYASDCYAKMGRGREALALAKDALRIFEDWFPAGHDLIKSAQERTRKLET